MESLSGDTGTGGLTALYAIGKQDEYLCNLKEYDPCYSPFLPQNVQHTEFIRYYNTFKKLKDTEDVNDAWPLNKTITFEFNPRTMGDLLANMFLKLKIIVGPSTGPGDKTWTDRIGRAIIEEIQFKVGNTVVETLTDYMLVGYDELFASDRDKSIKNYTENGQLHTNSLVPENFALRPPVLPIAYGSGDFQLNDKNLDLFINLNLFFSRTYTPMVNNRNYDMKGFPKHLKNWFPLCALYNEKIYVTLKFRDRNWVTNMNGLITCNEINLITEEISLSNQERLFIARTPQKFSYKTIVKQTIDTVDNTVGVKNTQNVTSGTVKDFSIKLQSDKPLSMVFWFLQNSRFSQNDLYSDSINTRLYLNRYNYSHHENFSNVNPYKNGFSEPYYSFEESEFQMLSKVFISSPDRDIQFLQSPAGSFSPESAVFFRNVQSQSKGVNIPMRNIYSYSFENDPNDNRETGSVNTTIKSKKKTYTINLSFIETNKILSNTYQLHVYNICYMNLGFQDGFLKKE